MKMQKEILPSKHPQFIMIHSNIAAVYEKLKEYTLALEHYIIAFNIAKQQSSTLMHPKLIELQKNIEIVKLKLTVQEFHLSLTSSS
ncbi:unnamed protein product [Didymodactylos carnosus]|uniref:Kinesin light chain n=1 Tax=Didymodactylos carnosus TaxID=1234261 RepID=A0A815Y0Q5_9BILA|nr:unnamed protein product [Didymodactylos carnosus]CAF1565139.1 unnamed protein product [Didymodactylos carnosus]CAF4128529.1 unnamed protein product [Didymodactylos carnosus]CAF4427162.1 unnamed protein product [Didymodactylos carnosus]